MLGMHDNIAILFQYECRAIWLDNVTELLFHGYVRNISVVVDMYIGFTKQVSNLASGCARHLRHQTMLTLILISRCQCCSTPNSTVRSCVNNTSPLERKYSMTTSAIGNLPQSAGNTSWCLLLLLPVARRVDFKP